MMDFLQKWGWLLDLTGAILFCVLAMVAIRYRHEVTAVGCGCAAIGFFMSCYVQRLRFYDVDCNGEYVLVAVWAAAAIILLIVGLGSEVVG